MTTSTSSNQQLVGSIARAPVRTIEPSATLRAAARALREANVGILVVLDGSDVTGVISERDLVTALAQGADPDLHNVQLVMQRDPRYITQGESVTSALEVMHRAGMRHLPVLEEGEIVGIVSLRDLAFAVGGRADP